VSIAYHLALKKAGKILLLEKGQLGEGSTSRCVGGIRSQFSTEINILFSLESIKTFERFEEEFGIDAEFKRIGYLFLATTESEKRVFEENIKLQRKHGIPVELLNSEEIKARWPYLRMDDILGGTFCSSDGYAGPNEVLSGFARGAKKGGVRIYEGAEVLGISLNNGKVKGVKTRDEISTRRCQCRRTLPRLLRGQLEMPVKPLRRQIFITAPFHLTINPFLDHRFSSGMVFSPGSGWLPSFRPLRQRTKSQSQHRLRSHGRNFGECDLSGPRFGKGPHCNGMGRAL
jgi:sarcosine oxidase subunit beta